MGKPNVYSRTEDIIAGALMMLMIQLQGRQHSNQYAF